LWLQGQNGQKFVASEKIDRDVVHRPRVAVAGISGQETVIAENLARGPHFAAGEAGSAVAGQASFSRPDAEHAIGGVARFENLLVVGKPPFGHMRKALPLFTINTPKRRFIRASLSFYGYKALGSTSAVLAPVARS
jgi:hypothetical protein